MTSSPFVRRHIGPRPDDLAAMLSVIGTENLDTLMDEAVPASIRSEVPLALPAAAMGYWYLCNCIGKYLKPRT